MTEPEPFFPLLESELRDASLALGLAPFQERLDTLMAEVMQEMRAPDGR